MATTLEAILADPVVAGAVAAHGLNPTTLRRSAGEIMVRGADAIPSIRIDDHGSDRSATIRWRRRGRPAARYENDAEGWIMTIEGHETPETVLAALAGAPLSALVDVPGADRMRIVLAVNSRAFPGDPLDTRASVEPMPQGDATTP